MTLPELATVILRAPKSDEDGRPVPMGSIGTVVHVHGDDEAYEIEVVLTDDQGAQNDAHLFSATPDEVELTWRPAPPEIESRVLGCLLGGAAGDAFGAPCEGRAPPPDLAIRPLSITDDTQLTLATCEAILATGRVDPASIAENFAELFRKSQLRGIGASTYKALSELAVGGHWALVGHQGERSAGNGAAMRVAPLGFLLDPTDWDDARDLRDVCRITHKHDEAYAGALAVALAIWAARTGQWTGRENLVEIVARGLPDTQVRDRLRTLTDTQESLAELSARHGAGGFVVESVPLALLAAQRVGQHGFTGTLERLVTLGGDSDTLCSIAGQVAGACLGFEGIPLSIMNRIEDHADLRASASRFGAFVASQGGKETSSA